MSAYTPGPWMVSPIYTRVAYVIPAEHASRSIGGHTDAALDFATFAQQICFLDCPDRHRSAKEMRANANLIALAPEMFEALTEIIAESTYDDYPNTPEHKSLERGRAVLAKFAKAEGKAS